MSTELYTIGHSSHAMEALVRLLQRNAIEAVADVRSHPYSRYNPQFRKANLEQALRDHGMSYVFLGRELGARSDDPRHYRGGRVQFHRLAAEPRFRKGVERVLKGMREYRIALMCAEKEPLECHRMILVCREMRSLVDVIGHILADGSVEPNDEAEKRLMRLHNLVPDMFASDEACIEQAYEIQARRIAYTVPGTSR